MEDLAFFTLVFPHLVSDITEGLAGFVHSEDVKLHMLNKIVLKHLLDN